MDKRLKDSEWIILQALWADSPLDLKDIIERVQKANPQVRWDYKTYHSFLRLLNEKGYVRAEKQGRNNRYFPAITQEQALSYETDSLVSRRGYYGTVSTLMVNMAEQGKLTQREKSELMALALRLAAEDEE